MKVVQTQAEVGEDRVLTVKLPDDVPVGPVEVLIVVETRKRLSPEERRAAAEAGRGALKGLISTDEFLAERHETELRREERLERLFGQ